MVTLRVPPGFFEQLRRTVARPAATPELALARARFARGLAATPAPATRDVYLPLDQADAVCLAYLLVGYLRQLSQEEHPARYRSTVLRLLADLEDVPVGGPGLRAAPRRD